MTLYEKFKEISLKFPRKKALFFQKDKLTYHRLREEIDNLAAGFYYSLGIKKASKVAILLHNNSQYVIGLFAIFRLGAIAIPLNVFLKTQELDYILSNCNPDYLITSTEFLPTLRPLREKIESKIILADSRQPNFLYLKDLSRKRYASPPKQEISEEAIAVISYTSSTTGKPKGVLLSHKNFISDVEGCLRTIDINYKDRFLIFLPIFHSYTLTTCVFTPLLIGATIYLVYSLKQLPAAMRLIFLRHITILVGIPRIFRIFSKINIPKFLLIFSSIRFAISGAAALAPEIITTFKKKFNITLLQGYGLTEASPVVLLNPLNKQKLGSVGLPLSNCKIKIVDEKGQELPANTPGELIVKGPMVMKGYFQLPRQTAVAIRDGWLFTGDIAKIDEEGYVYIIDRKKDMIIIHGMNVYPREVEEIIKTHPKVEEAAVVGKKDLKRGEISVAVLLLKEEEHAEAKDIISFLKEKIADYKIPRIIEFRKELPTTATGKILKRILREEINR